MTTYWSVSLHRSTVQILSGATTTYYNVYKKSLEKIMSVRILKTSRKLGRFAGTLCQHAFIIFLTLDGYVEGISSLWP